MRVSMFDTFPQDATFPSLLFEVQWPVFRLSWGSIMEHNSLNSPGFWYHMTASKVIPGSLFGALGSTSQRKLERLTPCDAPVVALFICLSPLFLFFSLSVSLFLSHFPYPLFTLSVIASGDEMKAPKTLFWHPAIPGRAL